VTSKSEVNDRCHQVLRVSTSPLVLAYVGESMDRRLAWYGSLLRRPRLPAAVGEVESNKIAAVLALAFFTCCGRRGMWFPKKACGLFGFRKTKIPINF